MTDYFRPIVSTDPARPDTALSLAGGWAWFDRVEWMRRDAPAQVIAVDDVPPQILARLTAPRAPLSGLSVTRPLIMGILNVTPDSFSDGGHHASGSAARARALEMAQQADILDIGGESTRPGAQTVPVVEEIARTCPVIADIRGAGHTGPISIDTRKSSVARAALEAGADMVNDVSGLGHDPDMAALVAESGAALCLMHSIETPATMQNDPRYHDVVLDVYDHLAARVAQADAAGIDRRRIIVDPGIGFGKTLAHNLALLSRISLFHSLGCAVLLGASRKSMIGALSGNAPVEARLPGSLAVALAAIGQGVQILRVHDTAQTAQAVCLYRAASTGAEQPEESR